MYDLSVVCTFIIIIIYITAKPKDVIQETHESSKLKSKRNIAGFWCTWIQFLDFEIPIEVQIITCDFLRFS